MSLYLSFYSQIEKRFYCHTSKILLIECMPKMSLAFLLSLLVHTLIAFFVYSTINKNPKEEVSFFDEKNLISLTFGKPNSKFIQQTTSKQAIGSSKSITVSQSTSLINSQSDSLTVSTGGGGSIQSSFGSEEGVPFGDAIENYKEPIYPKLAIRRGIEGDLEIVIKVGSDGIVQQVNISRSSGHESLDQATLQAVKSWIFKPRDASYEVTKKVVFKLK